MISFSKGRYWAAEALSQADIEAAQTLRTQAFGMLDYDADAYDARCAHILIRQRSDNRLVCCFRMLPLRGGEIRQSYSAQYYELSALETFDGPMVEMGRFCVDPEVSDADILRVAWAAMTEYVDRNGVQLLFGCSSFSGIETDAYLDAFAVLKARHLAPKRWLPRVKAPDVFRFAALLRRRPDLRKAKLRMPPLLKTYLIMGGWVSDHAVVDRQMNTLHVFTGLEVGAIPDGRKRLLRAVVG